MSQFVFALWGRINSLGGADVQWTLGAPPSGNNWEFLGDSDHYEDAVENADLLFEESGRILREMEE